jgi:AcrR family transcriptional regulator
VRVVAATSGWSTGVLSHYFEDKTDLLLHALAFVGDAARRRMARAAGLWPLAALRHVVLQALPLDETRRIEWQVWLAFWGKAITERRLADEQARLYRQWRAVIVRLIAAAQGRAARSSARRAQDEADALVAFIDGLGLQASLEPDRLPARRQRALVELYLARSITVGDDR